MNDIWWMLTYKESYLELDRLPDIILYTFNIGRKCCHVVVSKACEEEKPLYIDLYKS